MNLPLAIVLGTAMICATALTLESASSQSASPGLGVYQGVQAGNDRMFLIDTHRGRVAACVGSAPAPSCSEWSNPPP